MFFIFRFSFFIFLVFKVEIIQKTSIEIALAEVFVFHQFLMEGHGCLWSFNDELIQGSLHFADTLLTGTGATDEFGNH